MHAKFSPEELAFQAEVRNFLSTHFTPELAARIHEPSTFKEATIEWQKLLDNQGWAANGWPVEHGGCPWTATQKYIYSSELAAAGAPDVMPMGIKMVAPVLYSYGSDEQKARFLPITKRSDIWWCQGYSEPGAGSDLAALKTRAVLDGDHYVVSGSKIWTTYAQYADWMFCLVKTATEGRAQQSISFLLIDMKSAGISVSPIISIDGDHHLNEVHLDNVRVPVENRIGDENKGWEYAKALLNYERTALSGVAYCKRMVRDIEQLMQGSHSGFGLSSSDDIKARLADIEIDLMALEYLELSVLNKLDKGKAPGMESSLLKLVGTELQQALQKLRWDVTGGFAGVTEPGTTGIAPSEYLTQSHQIRREYMFGRAATIYGGSNEVQKNIIAKVGLGL
ncbi:acyl-CoA dehydrogenase family protein [Spongiibacter sp. KMU-158]|uniref:Acyl-CoA dehydrogenase family protein n=1 Tax=Spongiibacter pelagi TaxID=2760804 RepID=A0A927C134_9GAMM|nr:acyl-CoA dehydrogenase family protein [Spongiibacter pelagi]MBD2858082.1 acyl-CoA dehydrogenase family protein [Spongiibacter pelagi]